MCPRRLRTRVLCNNWMDENDASDGILYGKRIVRALPMIIPVDWLVGHLAGGSRLETKQWD